MRDEEAYLIRASRRSRPHRRQEDAFYSGDAWLDGPRAAVLAPIESYHTRGYVACIPG